MVDFPMSRRASCLGKKAQGMKRFLMLCFLLALASTLAVAEPDFSTPEKTLENYLRACEAGDFEAADLCYTASSRKYLKENSYLTQGREPAQLKKVFAQLSKQSFRTEQVNSKRAILHPDDSRHPPFFIRQQAKGEGWRIDFHFMTNYIKADAEGWSWRMKRAEKIWKSRK